MNKSVAREWNEIFDQAVRRVAQRSAPAQESLSSLLGTGLRASCRCG